jgi:hypothetical protein
LSTLFGVSFNGKTTFRTAEIVNCFVAILGMYLILITVLLILAPTKISCRKMAGYLMEAAPRY